MSTISDALPFGLREDAVVLAALRGGERSAADAVPGTRASWAGGFRRSASDSADGLSRAGLDALFDRYHPWLYGLFMRTLRDHDNATSALGQTLGNVAAARLTRPEQLRTAVARAAYESGIRVGEGRGRVTRIRRSPDATTQLLVGIMDAGGDGELRRLVWRAMETLSYRERLLFELEWHDRLDVRELITVIGGRNAQAVLNRARDRIRATLTTAVAVWYGSERCGGLRRLVRHAGAAEGRPGSMRTVIEQHLYGTRAEPPCEICLDSQDKYALAVLGTALPVFGVPPFLRDQAIEIAQEYRSGLRTAPIEHAGFAPGAGAFAGSLGAGAAAGHGAGAAGGLAAGAAARLSDATVPHAELPTAVTPIVPASGATRPTPTNPPAATPPAASPPVAPPPAAQHPTNHPANQPFTGAPSQRGGGYAGSPWGAPEELPPSSAYLSPSAANSRALAYAPAGSNGVASRRKRIAAGAVAAAAALVFSFSTVMLAQNRAVTDSSDVLAAATPTQQQGGGASEGPSPIGDPPDSRTSRDAPESDNYQIDTNTGNNRPVPIPQPRTTEGTAPSTTKPTSPSKTPPSTRPTKPAPSPSTVKPSPSPSTVKPTPTPTDDEEEPTTPPPDDPTTKPPVTPPPVTPSEPASPVVVPA